jgi:putative sugar O-methyltransferase
MSARQPKMPAPDTFEEDWLYLKDLLERRAIGSEKSAIWESLIQGFSAAGAVDDLFKEQKNRGYNFLRSGTESRLTPPAKIFQWATFAASVFFKKLSGRLWDVNLNFSRSGHLLGYPRYRLSLKRRGLWDEYRTFCEGLGMCPDSYNTAKSYFFADLILKSLPGSGPFNVMEIGAGAGILAVMLLKKAPISRYVIVDLPEMLLLSSRTLRHLCPDRPVRFSSCQAAGELALPERATLMTPSQDAARLPGDAFDLCLNIDSFQEMSREQVADYLSLAQRTAKNGATFLTVNRRKTVGSYDNNPLLYPYRANEVLRWQTEPFLFEVLKTGWQDPHLLRVEKIRK